MNSRNTFDLKDSPTSETNLLTNKQIDNILTWSDFETSNNDITATTIEMRNYSNNIITTEQIPTETTISTSRITQQAPI
ncbi:10566_t:CDS:1, partial [Acaulospora morrowiae]